MKEELFKRTDRISSSFGVGFLFKGQVDKDQDEDHDFVLFAFW